MKSGSEFRKHLVPAAIAVAACLALAAGAFATEKEGTLPPAPSSPAFDRLKALAGDWAQTGGDGSVAASYKVTANGSAVRETLFPGTPHEMLTVYTMEGGDVVLTHYCVLGNQPHMKAAQGTPANQLAFKYAGGGNIKAPTDAHMHQATITFVDADHITSEWAMFQDGKQTEVKKFDLTRKKS